MLRRPKVKKPNKTEMITLRVKAAKKLALDLAAGERGQNKTKIIERLITQFLEEQEVMSYNGERVTLIELGESLARKNNIDRFLEVLRYPSLKKIIDYDIKERIKTDRSYWKYTENEFVDIFDPFEENDYYDRLKIEKIRTNWKMIERKTYARTNNTHK